VGRGDRQEQAILDAAERLLGDHQFDALTVATVAEAAGISRPGVYFYFGSMEELLVAVVGRRLTELIDTLETVSIPPPATPRQVLEIGLRRTGEGWRSHGPVLKAAVEHAYRISGVHDQWRMLIDRGVELYVALMSWSADLDGRPAPDRDTAGAHAELCMLMVGHAFHHRYESHLRATDDGSFEHDLLLLVSRALELHPSPGTTVP
jgi:TetR/AcrR family transcriptional regulator, ethionamide resistance regulator